ncbi:hypothetical protein EBT23_02085 [bacterium]|nr:hypothetical protein [bacterium]
MRSGGTRDRGKRGEGKGSRHTGGSTTQTRTAQRLPGGDGRSGGPCGNHRCGRPWSPAPSG